MEKRTIRVDDFGILATDFGITDDQKNDLYDSDVKYTTAFLKALHDPVSTLST